VGESEHQKRVVVVGAGFGGLNAAKRLCGHGFEVLLVDRNSYHLFVPLLYQVATGNLGEEEIAGPLRQIFRILDDTDISDMSERRPDHEKTHDASRFSQS
jgi:NADH dehydrogenase